MTLIELYALAAGGIVAGLIAAVLLVLAVLAVITVVQTVVVEPWRDYLKRRRNAAEQAVAAAARIDAAAARAVYRLEQAYAEAVHDARSEASRSTS